MANRVVISANNVVTVHLAASDLFSVDKVQAIQKTVLGKLGHPLCCSGFTINYQLQEQELSA